MSLVKKYLFLFLMSFTSYIAQADCVYEQGVLGEELQVGVMLNWNTILEKSNSMFIVEKSEDGIDFSSIGTVKGAGDSRSLNKYSFLDINNHSAKAFYRLKQVDFDGSFSYSDRVEISKHRSNNFSVAYLSQVATTNNFDISLESLSDGELSYSLEDWSGNQLWDEKQIIVRGLNNIEIDLSGLEPAIYRVVLNMEDETETITLKKIDSQDKNKVNLARTKKN